MRLDELREGLQRVLARTPSGRGDAWSTVIHRGRQLVRRRRLARATAVVAVLAVLVAGSVALRETNRGTPPSTSVTTPSGSTPTSASTTTTSSSSTTSTTSPSPPPVSRAVATTRLDAFVAAEQAADSAAGAHSAENIWGNPVITEVSPPVLDDGTYIAAVAFSFDPGGHPLQILSFDNGAWSVTDALPAPSSPGMISHPQAMLLIAEGSPIIAGHLTRGAHPDFLVDMAGGGCYGAALVAFDTAPRRWQYVPFTGPFPTGDILGGNPQVVNGQLATENDCTAEPPPAAQRVTYTWTYVGSTHVMLGSAHPGWLVPHGVPSPTGP